MNIFLSLFFLYVFLSTFPIAFSVKLNILFCVLIFFISFYTLPIVKKYILVEKENANIKLILSILLLTIILICMFIFSLKFYLKFSWRQVLYCFLFSTFFRAFILQILTSYDDDNGEE